MLKVSIYISLVLLTVPTLVHGGDPFSGYRVIDMSYAYNADTIYWPTEDGFILESEFAGMTDGGYWYTSNKLTTAEHGGTHIDAPIHFAENQNTVDALKLDQLMGAVAVIDVSGDASMDVDYQVSVADIEIWESEHGRLTDGVIVLIFTGHGRHWPDRLAYLGTEQLGAEAVPKLHFPGLHPDTASWLVEERNINAIGLDTPSIDYGQSSLFESHRTLFAKNIPAFENVANLDQLPAIGAYVVALPMKIEGGSGGPLRMIGLIPE
jgi:kynurenine formamidase